MYETSTHMLAYTHKFAPDTNKRTHLANRFNICRLDFFFGSKPRHRNVNKKLPRVTEWMRWIVR